MGVANRFFVLKLVAIPFSGSRRGPGRLLAGLLLCAALSVSGSDSPAGPQPKTGRGFSYRHDEIPAMPWSIHVVKVDRSNPQLEFHVVMGKAAAIGLSTLREQIKSLSADLGQPVAAINGDFWNEGSPYEGDPSGLQVSEGELVSGPSERTCFWLDAAGNPHMTNVLSQFSITWPNGEVISFGLNEKVTNNGAVLYTSRIGSTTRPGKGSELVLERGGGDSPWLPLRLGQTFKARVREVRQAGDTPLSQETMVLALSPQLAARLPRIEPRQLLQISTATAPDLSGVKTALGGGPTLVRNGRAMPWKIPPPRHPRSAIGWNDHYLFLVEVDGRQAGLSVGMSFPELADYLVKIGCSEAMNLDGGGSSTLWVLGQVMNSPCYGHERNMANSLILVRKDRTQPD